MSCALRLPPTDIHAPACDWLSSRKDCGRTVPFSIKIVPEVIIWILKVGSSACLRIVRFQERGVLHLAASFGCQFHAAEPPVPQDEAPGWWRPLPALQAVSNTAPLRSWSGRRFVRDRSSTPDF